MIRRPPRPPSFPYTTLFRSAILGVALGVFLFGGTGTVENLAAPGSTNGGIAGFGAAMFSALWAYSGWQFLPMAAGEVRQRSEEHTSELQSHFDLACRLLLRK